MKRLKIQGRKILFLQLHSNPIVSISVVVAFRAIQDTFSLSPEITDFYSLRTAKE